jgi:hypothetical protein
VGKSTLVVGEAFGAMVDKAELEQLLLRVAAHRERATQARRLAAEINDTGAQHGLLDHANDQERRAEALEAQCAVLKQTAPIADPAQDIAAALKPPADKPDDTAT